MLFVISIVLILADHKRTKPRLEVYLSAKEMPAKLLDPRYVSRWVLGTGKAATVRGAAKAAFQEMLGHYGNPAERMPSGTMRFDLKPRFLDEDFKDPAKAKRRRGDEPVPTTLRNHFSAKGAVMSFRLGKTHIHLKLSHLLYGTVLD